MSELLKVGTKAPDFTLPSGAPESAGGSEESVSLKDFRGRNVILAFYPADWSQVCGDELAIYNQILPMFEKLNAVLLGISVDGVFSHQAFRENRGLKMQLLADFHPKGAVAQAYGVYDEKDGFASRALFVLDREGTIRYSFVSPVNVNPGAKEILETLKEIENDKGAKKMAEADLSVEVSKDDHIQGGENAPVTLVEYGDYECPTCGAAHPVVKDIRKEMGRKLRYVFRNFPLSQMHPRAEAAAKAAEAANAQNKFWEMHDLLLENQKNLTEEDLLDYGKRLKLDENQYASDLQTDAHNDKIQADFTGGIESGVNGTPTFFINGARFDGDWQNGDLLESLRQIAE